MMETSISVDEEEVDVYDIFSQKRKFAISHIVSLYAFLSPFSSTSILSATPEVASSYHTTGIIINLSNAVYMIFMGLSAPFWASLSQVYGRRMVTLISGGFFFAFSLSNVFAPNIAAYCIFRVLVAFQETSFLVIGAAVIGDIYSPTTRGTALSWFLFNGLLGPALGRLIGGILVTYQPWQVIFWVQAGLAGMAFILALLFLPEPFITAKVVNLEAFRSNNALLESGKRQIHFDLMWNIYALLSPIRYVLNPRFNLTSPMESALFYLAPGAGYLFGALFGGRWSDHNVKKMIVKREGIRVPEDRLYSTFIPLGIAIPLSILIYGWTIEFEVGGIPVPVIAMFVQGVGQLFALPSLSTYCLDVIPERSAEVVALNYMLRYFFAAGGTAVALPTIDSIGVGWFSTISSCFLITPTCLVMLTYKYGQRWREMREIRTLDDQQEAN